MKEKLNCILLVDDDSATNFLHKRIIERTNCTKDIKTFQTAQKALDYLTGKKNGKNPKPDLIFLDINMPGLNGWDFLEAYLALPKGQIWNIIIVMLTTSMNPDDRTRARQYPIQGYRNKPLTNEMLEEILKANFPEKF